MSQYEVTQKTKIKRLPDRAEYDRETIHGILDEALICHVGFVVDDQPYVIPTIHARVGDTLYLHGSAASRMLRTLGKGANASDWRQFHHSMNYRSVVILGPLEEVIDPDERNKVLDALVEHIIPGRLAEARRPTRKELKATTVVKIQISEASAKIRTGPPGDDDEDYDLPVWAGVIPLSLQPGKPISDPLLKEGIDMPDYVVKYAPGDGHPSK